MGSTVFNDARHHWGLWGSQRGKSLELLRISPHRLISGGRHRRCGRHAERREWPGERRDWRCCRRAERRDWPVEWPPGAIEPDDFGQVPVMKVVYIVCSKWICLLDEVKPSQFHDHEANPRCSSFLRLLQSIHDVFWVSVSDLSVFQTKGTTHFGSQ